jgi:hypothetical protein
MNIWVDADACPSTIKDILFRVAARKQILVTLIANHTMRIPNSPYINFYQVSHGFDVADNEIVKRVQQGDLVITNDIPLADQVINLNAVALSTRGEAFTKANIKAKLSMRDFMQTLRDSGVETSGPSAMSQKDSHAFAKQLELLLNQLYSH